MKALILVDLQHDFMPGGALAVPHGDQVIPIANRVQHSFDLVLATQDWHPPDHGSFAANHPGKQPGDLVDLNGLEQVLWPVHCVQETTGAALAPALDADRIERIFKKGTDPAIDSYSGFFDNGQHRSTGLSEYLKDKDVTNLYILGLATDYCVKFPALDARRLGFRTQVIEHACRGVELKPGDVGAALEEMSRAGVTIIGSAQIGR